MDINICALSGRLGKRPELQKTTTGKSVCTVSLAVNGAKPGSTTWFQLELWDKIAEHICTYCDAGSYIMVSGNIKDKPYTDKNGSNRHQFVVVVNNFQMTESKTYRTKESDETAPAQFQEFAAVESDEELPF